MKAIEQYFHVLLFSVLFKVVLTFNSVDKILACDHSNKSCVKSLSCGSVCFSMFAKQNKRALLLNSVGSKRYEVKQQGQTGKKLMHSLRYGYKMLAKRRDRNVKNWIVFLCSIKCKFNGLFTSVRFLNLHYTKLQRRCETI